MRIGQGLTARMRPVTVGLICQLETFGRPISIPGIGSRMNVRMPRKILHRESQTDPQKQRQSQFASIVMMKRNFRQQISQ